jgi:hypothetical protein
VAEGAPVMLAENEASTFDLENYNARTLAAADMVNFLYEANIYASTNDVIRMFRHHDVDKFVSMTDKLRDLIKPEGIN